MSAPPAPSVRDGTPRTKSARPATGDAAPVATGGPTPPPAVTETAPSPRAGGAGEGPLPPDLSRAPTIDDEPLLLPAAGRSERPNWALIVLTTLALLCAMYVARAVIMPVAFALVLTLTMRPVVRQLKRRGLPLPAGSAAVLMLVLSAFLAGVTYLVGPAQEWIDRGPDKLRQVGERLSPLRNRWVQIQEASEELEKLAEGKSEETPAGSVWSWFAPDRESAPPVEVEVRQPRLVSNLIILNSAGSFLAGAVVMFVLAFFLLSAGDVLINNVLRILPSMREKRNAVELVYNVEQGVSAYLFTVTCINVALGVVQGLAMWLLGMPNPALWGAMCCVLNFIPYLGALLGTIVVFLVAVLTFDTLGHASLVPAVYFGITAVEGNLVTPALLGRSMSLNPVMVFLFLTFWGWIWGIGGALLAVPLLAMLKIGFDQFERTRPIGTLLGG